MPDIPWMIPTKKTIVLNLGDTIVHQKVRFGKGPEVNKRPGLDKLIQKLQKNYEVVILSDDPYMLVEAVSQKIDPTLQFFFGRECFVTEHGRLYRDLKYLNRDPKNIVVIDIDKKRCKKHLENLILIPPFEGNTSDTTLMDMIPFLDRKIISIQNQENCLKGVSDGFDRFVKGECQRRERGNREMGRKPLYELFRRHQGQIPTSNESSI